MTLYILGLSAMSYSHDLLSRHSKLRNFPGFWLSWSLGILKFVRFGSAFRMYSKYHSTAMHSNPPLSRRVTLDSRVSHLDHKSCLLDPFCIELLRLFPLEKIGVSRWDSKSLLVRGITVLLSLCVIYLLWLRSRPGKSRLGNVLQLTDKQDALLGTAEIEWS